MNPTKSGKTLLLCSCQRSMDIDAKALSKALGLGETIQLRSELCRSEVAIFEQALAGGEALHIACTQEAPLFQEIAEDKGSAGDLLQFTNIRERAGWCEAKSKATPKIAALLAEAAYPAKSARVRTLTSNGVCLVYGKGQAALDVAQQLSGRLSVSVVLLDAADVMPPSTVSVPINKGRIKRAGGHLGAFKVEVDGYAPMLPSSRGALEFVMPRDGAKSDCDLIFDLSGGSPLFSAASHRDGYFHVDPNHPAAIAKAMFEITDLVGEFEKPLYVNYDSSICAHSRSRITGCSNCLDNCPTGAITSAGDHVSVDSAICGGCGNCSAVCPTGAVSYEYPPRHDLVKRVQILLSTFVKAGGSNPILMVHDESHGSGLIAAMARFGKGLPVNVLPLSVYSVFQLGHEAIAAALASGASQVVVMAPPDKPQDLPALESQTELSAAILSGLGYAGTRVHILNERDPDAAEEMLHALPALPAIKASLFDPVGSKRDVARAALAKLHDAAPAPADHIVLPLGAPYGRIDVDLAACTLCLSCVGACPANALADHPEKPQLSFTEAACVQCGICVATCPEKAILLAPRFNFTPAALNPEIVKTEEPFACIRCSKPFGSKSSIEKVVSRLKSHSMFKGEGQTDLIQMCDNCRVEAMAERNDDPFSAGPRPAPRTTDDYLAEDAAAAAATPKKKPEDFLG